MKLLLAIVAGVFLSAVPARADLTVERKVKLTVKDILGTPQKIHREERLRIRNGNLRIEDLTFGEVWIVRMDQKILWRIDTMSKTYSEWTFDAIARRRQEVIDQIKAAQKVVEKSGEEKALVDILTRFADIRDPAALALKEDPGTETIAGMACRSRKLEAGDRQVFDAWFCDQLPEGADYFKALSALGCIPDAAVKKLDGRTPFPMKGHLWYTWLLDRVTANVETTAVSQAAIEDREFSLPEGYKKVLYPAFDDIPERPVKKADPKKDFSEDDMEKDANPFKQNK